MRSTQKTGPRTPALKKAKVSHAVRANWANDVRIFNATQAAQFIAAAASASLNSIGRAAGDPPEPEPAHAKNPIKPTPLSGGAAAQIATGINRLYVPSEGTVGAGAETRRHGRSRVGASPQLADVALPVPIAIPVQDALLAGVEAGLAKEVLGLVRSFNQLGRRAKLVGKEIPEGADFCESVSVLLGLLGFQFTYAIAQLVDRGSWSLSGRRWRSPPRAWPAHQGSDP